MSFSSAPRVVQAADVTADAASLSIGQGASITLATRAPPGALAALGEAPNEINRALDAAPAVTLSPVALLRRLGLQARKRLSQSFLVDRRVAATIARAAELTADD